MLIVQAVQDEIATPMLNPYSFGIPWPRAIARALIAMAMMLWPCVSWSGQTPTVLIQVDVNTAYTDSPEGLAVVETLLARLPAQTVSMPTGTSPSQLILDNFRVSTFDPNAISYLPGVYKLIESALLKLNGVERPEQLVAGRIKIPGLPKRALADFNPANPLNALPKLSIFSAERMAIPADAADVSELTLNGNSRVVEAGRPASQSTIVDVEIPVDEAAQLFKDEEIAGLIRAFNYPVTVNLAACETSGPGRDQDLANNVVKLLSDADATELSAALAGAKRRTTLFVLDTGWPSSVAFAYSRSALNELFDVIWKRLQLAPPKRSAAPAFQEPTNPHVKSIEMALQEFEAQDSKDMVRVVYVPLTKEQGSRQLLIELIQLNYLYSLATKSAAIAVPTSADIQRARQAAEVVVDRNLPAAWAGQEVRTDKAVIDAVLSLGRSFAEINQGTFFVNESWTTSHEVFQVFYPTPLRGLVVAAAGNSADDVVHRFRDFAQRSLLHRDTVAVVNTDSTGTRLCCTSVLATGFEDDTFAVGFDGRVTSSTCDSGCGTSFASPRVAWLLAASESLRLTVLDAATWQLSEFQRLRALRDSTKKGLGGFWIGPLQIVKREVPKS